MKCPDCKAELRCGCPSAAHKHEAGRKWIAAGDQIKCPVCGFSAHMDYWEALSNKEIRSGKVFRPKAHWLKIAPEYFAAILERRKTFEIRKDDRGFRIGDKVFLQMWSLEHGYHNAIIGAEITYITDYPDGLKPGYVVLSIELMED